MSDFKKLDLIKTIEDDEDVPDYSDESEVETEYQPTKVKVKSTVGFDAGFKFDGSTENKSGDHWNDVAKYVKRKAKRKTDDKIALVNSEKKLDGKKSGADDDESDSDILSDEYCLSDEDLKKDDIKTKLKKKKKDVQFSEIIDGQEITSFYEMNLSRPLMKGISAMNFVHPTPIQSATIPVALLGRDICGCAATGTGKTAAYMLPIMERLLYRPQTGVAVTRVLVVVPTRELGVQVYQVSKQLAQFTSIEFGLSVGGLDVKTQEAFLRKQPDIVIATPGRLIDHIKNTPGFALDCIEVLVLDEADRMLDEHFAEQMKEIMRQCARGRQTLLFSATMTTSVEDLAKVSLSNPVKIFVDSNQNVAFNLRQEFVRIRKDKESDRDAILAALLCRTFRSNCIVFVPTKNQAHRLHIMLGLLNIQAGELHGNMRQPQRLDALNRFRTGEIDVLVATDVAARGLDIVGVRTVVNYLLPSTLEHYIHRVGRTARAGRSGVSISLAGEGERKLVKEIVKKARHPVKSRIIPPDILEKYRKKVQNVESDIQRILREEKEERLMEEADKQVNQIENKLNKNGVSNQPREWFQTKKERKAEKEKLQLQRKGAAPSKKNKNKKKNEPELPHKNRKKKKTEAAQPVNNRRKKGPPKAFEQPATGKKRKKSSFDVDLTNVSRKKVKSLRHAS